MRWTEEEIKYLEKNYGKISYVEIAKALGRTPSSVKQFASRHDIRSAWTSEQDKYLEKWYGYKSYTQIAKAVGRSEKSIHHRAIRLGLGEVKNATEDITIAEVSRLVGKKWGSIGIWNLKTRRVGPYTMVSPEDLFEFMKNNPHRYDATECEKYYFENEDWFREKLLEDRKKKCDARWGIDSA